MANLTAIERRGRKVIGQLRKNTLSEGNPFMIYDEALPDGKYYLEYPDGEIKIVGISHRINDFVVHEELDSSQVISLRQRLKLPPVF